MNARIIGLLTMLESSKDQFRIISRSSEFDGRLSLPEIVIKRASEPPLDRHRHEDLAVYVLDRHLTFHIDGQQSGISWLVGPPAQGERA